MAVPEACYSNREDAGQRLARAVAGRFGVLDLVVGVARGGVLVARPVAAALGLPLDVRIVRKFGAPGQPERALGAVLPDGTVRWLEEAGPLPPEETRSVLADALAREAREREALYRTVLQRIPAAGKRILLIDDGAATGASLIALIECLRKEGAAAVMVALPVAPPETVSVLEAHADALWVAEQPGWLWAVGMAYADFPEVTDVEVLAVLGQALAEGPAKPSGRPPEAA